MGSKTRLQNDMRPKNIQYEEVDEDMDHWDTEENTIRPIQTFNKAEKFLNCQKPSQTNNTSNQQLYNERQQNYHSNIQVTQNNAGKFQNYLSNNGNSFPPKNVNIDITQMQNFRSNVNLEDDDLQKVQLRPMQKINQNRENVQPQFPNSSQSSLKMSTQAASFQSRAYSRYMNTSQGKIKQVSPRQEEEQVIDPVYKKMFKNLVQARDRSPQIGVKTEQHVKKYRNNPDQLKSYFTQPNEDDKQRIREINQQCSQRLLEKGQTYQLKKEILKKYEEVAQMKECVFIPHTNRSTSPKRNIDEYTRDQEQFILQKQRKIQEKMILIQQEEQERQNVNFVCKGSQKLLQNVARYQNLNGPLDVSSNLYEQGKNKQLKRGNMLASSQSSKELRDNSQSSLRDNLDKSELFYPKINKKSQLLQRNESVENILYKDALDRRKNSKIRESQSRNRESIHRISQKQSDKYLIQGFKTEFDMAVQRLEIQFDSESEYLDLFKELGFISEINEKNIQEQKGLVQDSCISTLFKFSKEKTLNVYYLLLAVMNINPFQNRNQDCTTNDFSSFEIHSQNNELNKMGNHTIYENEEYMYGASNGGSPPYRSHKKDISSILNQNYLELNNGILYLNDDQVKVIHKFFLPLYYQRQNFLKIRRKKSTSPQRVEPTFKPALTQKTVKLADKVLKKLKNNQIHNNSKHFDMLLQRGDEIKQKKNAQFQVKLEAEVDSCTFKPQISETSRRIASSQSTQNLSSASNSHNQSSRFIELYNEHKIKKKYRQDKTTEQVEYEKAMEECTFQPNSRGKSNDRIPVVKGNIRSTGNSDSHIEQDNSRNLINETKQQNNQSPKNKYHREVKPQTNQTNQNIMSEENLHTPEPHKDPLYVIAIEIEGIKYQIKIFENDKPEDTVRNFFKDKNLSERIIRKIIRMVSEQMDDANNQQINQDEIQNDQKLRRPPTHKGTHLDPNDPAQTLGNMANKEKKTFYLETSAFLTGVNIVEKGPKRLDDYIPKAAEINQHHQKLNELISDLGGKISDVIKDHENDFFVAFKNKMYAIMKEMRELKEKASSERHKAKQEARLINLEKERDWFRREALKLDKMCKDHKRILNKLKATLENIEEDRDFFQEQLFNAKKVNKALLMELEKYKSSLMNVGTDSGYNTMKLQYNQPLAIQEDDSKFQRKQNSTTKLKAKIDQALKQNPDEVDNLLYDEDNGENTDFKYKDEFDDIDYKYLEDNDGGARASEYKFLQSQQQSTVQKDKMSKMEPRAIEPPVSNGGMVSIEEYRKIVQENAELKEREIKYTETIRHLKNQIDSEKKNARSLRAEKVNFMMQRNELEEFFLQCIEEVRKDIVKRKSITTSYQSKKNLKRSTSTASMTKQGSQAYQDEQIPNAKLDQYTATDKRKVIELLMSNENVLLFLYEKLFPATNLSSQSTQSRQNTAGMSLGGGMRFTTDSGIPIGNPYTASQSTMQGRSQTSVGGSRININRGNLNSLGGYGVGIDPNVITQSTLPQASMPGMSIQNNIQNLNLNINLSKAGYGAAQQFLPQSFNNTRGATAPIGQARTKKGMQVQLNALGKGNKYAI